MKKALTSFRMTKRLILQITTMPAVAALLLIITVLLTGTTTTTTMPRVAVWATTGTVSNENVTDTDVATQGNEGLRGEEPQQSTTLEEEQPSAANQSQSTILALSNSTNATAAANAINTTNAGVHGRIVFEKSPTGDDPYSTEIYVMNADDGSG